MHLWLINHLSVGFFYALCVASVLYGILPHAWKLHGISGVTLIFLGGIAPWTTLWLMISTLLVWMGLTCLSSRYRQMGIGVLIVILAAGFLINQYETRPVSTSILPNTLTFLGIAYYTCRHIHVLVEAHKEKIQSLSLIDYVHYQFFLPVMINGPIHRYPHFLRSCQRRNFQWEQIFQGLERILYGYAKVILIGNDLLNLKLRAWLEVHLNATFGAKILLSGNDWAVLYAVFSGYTDVALGFCMVWGFHLEENFNAPFKARNLIEFWQRWHITLSQWCKDYLYLPVLAFSRSSALGVICAMMGIGLWHQLSLFYFLWACYQALGIILCRLYQRFDPLCLSRLPAFIRHGLTRTATFSWIFSAKPVVLLLLMKLGVSR